MSVEILEVEYKNFGKCVKIINEVCELLVTVDLGPRIISYKLHGYENVMKEDEAREIKNDSNELKSLFGENETWYIYGGHRLWSSPEQYPASYVPDNYPVSYKVENNTVIFTPKATITVEQHEISITLNDNTSNVKSSIKSLILVTIL